VIVSPSKSKTERRLRGSRGIPRWVFHFTPASLLGQWCIGRRFINDRRWRLRSKQRLGRLPHTRFLPTVIAEWTVRHVRTGARSVRRVISKHLHPQRNR
jgi:hypothetical protein